MLVLRLQRLTDYSTKNPTSDKPESNLVSVQLLNVSGKKLQKCPASWYTLQFSEEECCYSVIAVIFGSLS